MATPKTMAPFGLRIIATAALPAALFALVSTTSAGERIRVDLFRTDGSRQGYAGIDRETGRVDTYDARSRRTGYGRVYQDGRLDLFAPAGTRAGQGRTRPAR